MEPAPWPVCWRIHPDDAAQFATQGKHCETRRCRNPIAMVTWRWWRSAAAGRVLVAEHEVCVQHGREFAERHGIEIEPAPEHEARRLSEQEMAAFAAEGRHCDGPACQDRATCVFRQHYGRRGRREVLEHLACDGHAPGYARRLHAEIGPAPEEGDCGERPD
jgi:hypothetical protein